MADTEHATTESQGLSTVQKVLMGMLIFVPIALIGRFVLNLDAALLFILSGAAIIPLAKFIGDGTEELALHIGPKFGGLLNATLGNAAELIITIFAINRGLLDLVKASITGSILGNLLLIMGLSLLLGGIKNGVQIFDRRTAGMNATLMILGVGALLIPSFFDSAIVGNLSAELGLSEGVAVAMIVLYALYVFYTFQSQDKAVVRDSAAKELDPHHKPKWSVRTASLVLVGSTLGMVFMSEILVGTVEQVSVSLGLTEIFIGVIIVPLIGNAAEHLVAVQVAYKNKMELSMAISLGSSLQIALFVAPILVFIALLFGQNLLLVFTGFELVAIVIAAVVAAFIAQDGESNWLEGAMLLVLYIIIAVAFFFLPLAEAAVH
jgi:Ca2+:H+ antiporter